MSIYGQVRLPALSFKYRHFEPAATNLFLVSNEYPKRQSYDDDDYSPRKEQIVPLMGMPYLVDANNSVLLDSISVESVYRMPEADAKPLYRICLKRPTDRYHEDVLFYMDNKGRGYHGKIEEKGMKKQGK